LCSAKEVSPTLGFVPRAYEGRSWPSCQCSISVRSLCMCGEVSVLPLVRRHAGSVYDCGAVCCAHKKKKKRNTCYTNDLSKFSGGPSLPYMIRSCPPHLGSELDYSTRTRPHSKYCAKTRGVLVQSCQTAQSFCSPYRPRSDQHPKQVMGPSNPNTGIPRRLALHSSLCIDARLASSMG
jgi:hypothetical protein